MVAHSLSSRAVIRALEAMIAERGAPTQRSLDDGSEFRGRAFDAWAADRSIELSFIQPGKPIQNSHVGSLNGLMRDEYLNAYGFLSLEDAQFHIEGWRWNYNTDRPHECYFPSTPTEYAEAFSSPAARLPA